MGNCCGKSQLDYIKQKEEEEFESKTSHSSTELHVIHTNQAEVPPPLLKEKKDTSREIENTTEDQTNEDSICRKNVSAPSKPIFEPSLGTGENQSLLTQKTIEFTTTDSTKKTSDTTTTTTKTNTKLDSDLTNTSTNSDIPIVMSSSSPSDRHLTSSPKESKPPLSQLTHTNTTSSLEKNTVDPLVTTIASDVTTTASDENPDANPKALATTIARDEHADPVITASNSGQETILPSTSSESQEIKEYPNIPITITEKNEVPSLPMISITPTQKENTMEKSKSSKETRKERIAREKEEKKQKKQAEKEKKGKEKREKNSSENIELSKKKKQTKKNKLSMGKYFKPK